MQKFQRQGKLASSWLWKHEIDIREAPRGGGPRNQEDEELANRGRNVESSEAILTPGDEPCTPVDDNLHDSLNILF